MGVRLIVHCGASLLGGIGMEALKIAVFEANILPITFDQQDPCLQMGLARRRQP